MNSRHLRLLAALAMAERQLATMVAEDVGDVTEVVNDLRIRG